MTDRLLMDSEEARKLLGVGEKMFPTLGIPFVAIGKRRRYLLSDLEAWIFENRKEVKCRSVKGKIRRSGGTISPSRGLGFEEARKRLIDNSPKQ